MRARAAKLRKTTVREFAKNAPRIPADVVIVPTRLPVVVGTAAGFASVRDDAHAYSLTLVPRYVAEQEGAPHFDSYAAALDGIRRGEHVDARGGAE